MKNENGRRQLGTALRCMRCGSTDISVRFFGGGVERHTCHACGHVAENRFLRPRQYGEKHGIVPSRVRRLLLDGRIPGAYKDEVGWKIPEGAIPEPATKGPKSRWEKTE